MDVEIDDQVAYLLAVLAEQEIPIPKELFLDLQAGRLGSLDSAAALGKVTAELFKKMPAKEVDFPDIFETLFEATRDAFAEMEGEWRARWSAEVEQRDARAMTPKELAKLRQAAKRKRQRGRVKSKRARRAA